MSRQAELRRSIEAVLDDLDDVVVVFSGLWAFGHRLGVAGRAVPGRVLDALLEAVGPRTLIMPAYTNSFPRTRRYDMRGSKPETGILCENAFASGLFERTSNPMDSYFVRGPRAGEVLALPEPTLWGPGSVMAWFEDVNARILILGELWHKACSFYHRGEDEAQVPYRYFKRFSGIRVERDGGETPCSAVMFVRPFHQPIVWDHTKVRTVMGLRGVVHASPDPQFPVESAKARDIVAACMELLSADPFAYVGNADAVRAWVAEGGVEREIEELPQEQRV